MKETYMSDTVNVTNTSESDNITEFLNIAANTEALMMGIEAISATIVTLTAVVRDIAADAELDTDLVNPNFTPEEKEGLDSLLKSVAQRAENISNLTEELAEHNGFDIDAVIAETLTEIKSKASRDPTESKEATPEFSSVRGNAHDDAVDAVSSAFPEDGLVHQAYVASQEEIKVEKQAELEAEAAVDQNVAEFMTDVAKRVADGQSMDDIFADLLYHATIASLGDETPPLIDANAMYENSVKPTPMVDALIPTDITVHPYSGDSNTDYTDEDEVEIVYNNCVANYTDDIRIAHERGLIDADMVALLEAEALGVELTIEGVELPGPGEASEAVIKAINDGEKVVTVPVSSSADAAEALMTALAVSMAILDRKISAAMLHKRLAALGMS
jgi:hypothetical protein